MGEDVRYRIHGRGGLESRGEGEGTAQWMEEGSGSEEKRNISWEDRCVLLQVSALYEVKFLNLSLIYLSPCGKKFRSKPQIARFLGEMADLTCFDFSRAGNPGDGTQRRRARDRGGGGGGGGGGRGGQADDGHDLEARGGAGPDRASTQRDTPEALGTH